MLYLCVCVCVRVRERERERATVGCPEVDSDVKMCLWRVIIERKWMRKLLIK